MLYLVERALDFCGLTSRTRVKESVQLNTRYLDELIAVRTRQRPKLEASYELEYLTNEETIVLRLTQKVFAVLLRTHDDVTNRVNLALSQRLMSLFELFGQKFDVFFMLLQAVEAATAL